MFRSPGLAVTLKKSPEKYDPESQRVQITIGPLGLSLFTRSQARTQIANGKSSGSRVSEKEADEGITRE